MSTISIRDVEYVAGLAKLELDVVAKERLVHELGEILAYVDQLNTLETDGIEPMMHALEITNVYREDAVGASLPRETALANAPRHDGEYFLVPKILEVDD